jgi:hypothetical protein
MRKGTSDLAAGAFFVGVGLVFLPETLTLEGVSAVLPELLVAGLLLGGVYLLALGAYRRLKTAGTEESEPSSIPRILIIGIGSVAYVLAAPVLGFYASSFVFLFIMASILAVHDTGKVKAALTNIVFACIMCAFVWTSFNYLLSVPTPEGILF